MRTFADIYETLDLDAEPKPRSIYELKVLLETAYELAENKFFSTRDIFDIIEDSPIALHRTTAKRMLLEVDGLQGSKQVFVLTSQGIEIFILHIYVIQEFLIHLPSENEEYSRLVFAGQLKAILRGLVDSIRDGVVGTTKLNIMRALDELQSIDEKIKYCKKLILNYKQRKSFFDNKQYEQLCEFINFEQEKLEVDLIIPASVTMTHPSHSVSVGTGGIANFNYAVGAVQNLNTGTGAQQNAASGASITQSMGGPAALSLNEIVQQLAHFIVTDEAFAPNRQEMEQQLETVKVQLQKSEPKKGIIMRALESFNELAADGAGTMAGHAIFEVVHKAFELLATNALN